MFHRGIRWEMPVDESKFTHVRIPNRTAKSLKKLADAGRRSVNMEANIAVEDHIKRKNKNGR